MRTAMPSACDPHSPPQSEPLAIRNADRNGYPNAIEVEVKNNYNHNLFFFSELSSLSANHEEEDSNES